MKKILIIISLILILFLSYGYYDGYVQKEITVGKNIYTHVHYTQVGKDENNLHNPMSAYEINYDEEQINEILLRLKELELLGQENFIKKYGKLFEAQTRRIKERYNLFLHKQKLLKANIKKKNVYPISLFGYVPPLKDSLIEPKELTFMMKNLKKLMFG